ncbi:ABC transporter substrate-binding protein [Sagittula stellata]|uniref:Oligopeptide ABC transporter, solute-binding protein n=1 Tax=Sagittula stellata (strain ATCC 700073 / DSM 11524 / E-37) TaxID=388399 RepID=A3K510_SAGS3|nr:ABC transporter substrate-binding protein [Sagittula stellata]EBA07611.1 oligopeptide ABC transporter, solute-binding protein [Sagittula stellata E-37]
MRHLATTLALAALTFGQPAPAQEADQPIRVITSFQIDSMDPESEGFWFQEFGVAELLMEFQRDGSVAPWLAESLEQVDDLTWVITLNKGVTFQNGRQLDADAVKRLMDFRLANKASLQGVVPPETTFDVTGPLEITVKTPVPLPEFPNVLAHESYFLIYDLDAVEAANGDWEALEHAGIYTGPYEVTDLTDAALTATRNENYWRGTPAMPGVTVTFVTDLNARVLAIQNGEGDIALYPQISAKPVYDATPNVNLALGDLSTGGYAAFMNTEEGPLADVAVRRALMKSIDYAEVSDAVFRGATAEAEGLYSTAFPWAVANYEHDPEEAARLLDEAGWTLDGDIRTKDGAPLTVKLVIYPQQPDLVPLSNALQAYLRALGVGTEILSVDDVNEAITSGSIDWDMALLGNGSATVGAVQGFLARYLASDGNRNYAGYSNARMDDLIAALAVEVDKTARNEILREIQGILVEDDPYVFNVTMLRPRALVSDAWSTYEPGVAWRHIGWQTAPDAVR